MGRVKKQHFVPQFYLRNFSSDGKKLFVYDKSADKEFVSNVSDVASENAFYDMPEVDPIIGIENFIEKQLHPFEEMGAEAIKKLLSSLKEKRYCRIHPDIKVDLSLYLAVQYMRSKETRETMVEMFSKIKKEEFYQFLCNESPDLNVSRKDFDIYLEEDKKSAYHSLILTDEDTRVELSGELHKNYWYIAKNCTNLPLYTSDQPLVKHGHLDHPIRSMQGFSSPGIEVVFPLSHEYLLIICDYRTFPHAKKLGNQIVSIKNEQNIVYYNHLQVHQSYRQIFSNESGFDLAKQIVREEPWVGDINSPRIHEGIYEIHH